MASRSAWWLIAMKARIAYSSPMSRPAPLVLPVSNHDKAPLFTAENAPHPNRLLDTSPYMPAGPVGKQVMFVGSSLRADLISDRFFVSLTREADTGGLTLETLPV